MIVSRLTLIAGTLTRLALARSIHQDGSQHMLDDVSSVTFKCDIPPAVDPSKDGLPAARDIFSGNEALLLQVKRHSTIVKIPSISYDDNGEPGEDPRWDVFYDLHRALAALYPNM
ncbi:hypothetical protein PC116_g30694 [Phytophthora cactorum]|nr:hypothetical protein PC116_g30694 [Phytophthora cactorum]